MAGFRSVREALLLFHNEEIIDDEEFLLLYDMNKSRNAYEYWTYEKFDLDSMNDAETWSEFRFFKNDLFRFKDALRIPNTIHTYNRLRVSGLEGLCIFLKRLSYPCRYSEFIPRFGRPVPDYCIICKEIMNHIYNNFNNLLTDFNHPFLSRENLSVYCQAIYNKGAALSNCFGFIDGTVRPICRPKKNQRTVYNGHKKVHSLKFQSVVLPNGLIGNMFGPLEGKRHDCALLRESALLGKLNTHAFDTNESALCLYGDPAYPITPHLLAPFPPPLTPEQQRFNTAMSKLRVSVEWLFGDKTNWFAFIDFKKNQQIGLSAVGKMYLTCALLTNARTCLYGNLTSDYFDVAPPTLEEYFH